MAKKKKRLIGVVLLLLVLVGVIYWFMHRGQEETDDAAIDAHIVALAPKVAGYITEVTVTDNQLVKQGDVIAKIDPRDYQFMVSKAQADYDSAQAKLAAAGHNYASTKVSAPLTITSARAQVAAANAEWQRTKLELTRMQKLGDAARSRQELETAVAREKSARSSLEDAESRLKSSMVAPNTVASAQAQVQDLEAAVEMAKANLAQAQKDLADTTIIAPIDGRITQRHVELGAYVLPGQQLLALVGNDYWVTANYKENQLVDMKPGQKVEIKIDAYPGRAYAGKVDSIQRGTGARFSAFPPENATGNFVKIVQRVPVKILFDERPDENFAIGPGMSVVPVVYTR